MYTLSIGVAGFHICSLAALVKGRRGLHTRPRSNLVHSLQTRSGFAQGFRLGRQ